MKSAAIFNADFVSLRDTDTVAEATRRMLASRVSNLPVIDSSAKLLGMLKLERLLAALLPRAALIGYGMADLTFVSDTVEHLRERMREIEAKPVHDFLVKPEHVVHPDTSPIEIVLLLYKGANSIPVVARDTGKLVAMVAGRDVLAALQSQ